MAAYNQGGATLAPFVASGALTRGQLVELTSTEEQVQAAGAASAKAIGFVTADTVDGEWCTVHMLGGGGIAAASAGGSIAIGDYLVAGASGVVTKLTLGASNQYVVGKALRAAASGDIFPVAVRDFIAQGA